MKTPFEHSAFKIGILGGGQLGKMLCQAASQWNFRTYVLDQETSYPAATVCNVFQRGDFTAYDDVWNFGKSMDVLTVEIETINTDALEALASEGVLVNPAPHAIKIIKDKGLQKQFYRMHSLPTSFFRLYDSADAIIAAVQSGELSVPFVQKARSGGYDGRGVQVVRTDNDLQRLIPLPSVVEELVDIALEISVIVARNQKGEIKSFPPTSMQMHPEANLVEYLSSPSGVGPAFAQEAIQLAHATIEALEMNGTLAVEMFLTHSGQLMINEVAPRVHNSGHHTIESCNISQFQQHLLAICNLPLIDVVAHSPAVMVNLLGAEGYTGPAKVVNASQCLAKGGVHIHLYGKESTRPFRKMGHATIVKDDLAQAMETATFVKEHLKIIA